MTDANVTTIDLTGDISVRTVAELLPRLRAALDHGAPIVLAGAETEQTDAAGLQAITALVQSAQRQGLPCTWSGISENLRKTISVLGLQTALAVPATE